MITKLNKAFVDALNTPEAESRFTALMAEPVASSPVELALSMKGELRQI